MPVHRSDRVADALAAMSGEPGGNAGENEGIAPSAGDPGAGPPAPDPSVFAPRERTRDLIVDRQIVIKRTMIPILLTCGVLLALGGCLRWLAGPGTVYAAWPTWMAATLLTCGCALLCVALLNMLQVRNLLLRWQNRTPRPPV